MAAVRFPSVEWNMGASRLKASRGSDGVQRGGGQRGAVIGFSLDSRRRLLQLIGSIIRDATLPMFVTLTYPDIFPLPCDAKRHFAAMVRRLKRSFPMMGMIWKIEPQERGAPHFHCLVWGVQLEQLRMMVPIAWFEIAGDGDYNHLLFHSGLLGNEHCCQRVRSYKGVWFYAAKYLGKTFEIEGWRWPGRFWGVINRENIPFGDLCNRKININVLNDVIRYQRRFIGGVQHHARGLTIFCDADQWVEKLQITGKTDAKSVWHGEAEPMGKSASCDEKQSDYASSVEAAGIRGASRV